MTRLLTLPEIAERLRCSEYHARTLLRRGAIEGGKPAGRWAATEAAVDAYYRSTLNTTQSVQRRRRRRAS